MDGYDIKCDKKLCFGVQKTKKTFILYTKQAVYTIFNFKDKRQEKDKKNIHTLHHLGYSLCSFVLVLLIRKDIRPHVM
jgi:hypothetical protein